MRLIHVRNINNTERISICGTQNEKFHKESYLTIKNFTIEN